ncbi:antitoxin [Zavarzinia compransoris]|uniref:type II toxin-antitoxin system RelB family antitoxin n=1 Tax=Zavarzinia marina TaxID=2911065 RepID=UPI001F1AF633|nr:antitoxin [Zavarzinia marina]MCF4166822.1 antitoxin [Zavarzinia marina]
MAGNSPLVSEFETDEQERDYALWLSAKVEAALANPHPPIAHDDVMAEMDAVIAAAEASKNS